MVVTVKDDLAADNGARLVPVSALSPERAQALLARHRELAAEIEALASRVGADGGAGRLAGHLLRLALVTPDGYQALHAAGDQPVLVNWGHAVAGQTLPEMDVAAAAVRRGGARDGRVVSVTSHGGTRDGHRESESRCARE